MYPGLDQWWWQRLLEACLTSLFSTLTTDQTPFFPTDTTSMTTHSPQLRQPPVDLSFSGNVFKHVFPPLPPTYFRSLSIDDTNSQ